MNNENTLHIFSNGIRLGSLKKNKQGTLALNYDNTWLESRDAYPVSLSLPLTTKQLSGEKVYNYFDNLLPDNPVIRHTIQTKFQLRSNHPFDLLACIGKDCVGSIQLLHDNEIPNDNSMRFTPVTEKEIAGILRSHKKNPLGMSDSFSAFRLSIAGAQEKTAFLQHNNTWCVPESSTPTSHIFKLPIGHLSNQNIDLSQSCENEWLCSEIVRAFGLAVADTKIKVFDGVKTLVVKRFDRAYNDSKNSLLRLPQEDMCQALGLSPHLKYEADGGPGIQQIMAALLGSEQAALDREHFFRSQIIFWLLCAIDGHAKNISIFLKPGGLYQLTPFYDILSAYPIIANKELHERKAQMAMALRGKNVYYKWYEAKRSHFLETAKKANITEKQATSLLDDTLTCVDSVIDHVATLIPSDFPEEIASSIFKGMLRMRDRLVKHST